MTVPRRVTLSDVARRAGVSGTTVSYILNGRADQMRIATATQARVRAAVAELGYRPNESARSLRTRRTRSIGVISDFIASGSYASQMLSGAGWMARRHRHVLFIGETEGDPEVEAGMIEEMLDRGVDGILYARLVTARSRIPDLLAGRRVMLLNVVDAEGIYPSVVPDEYQGGRSAAQLLVDLDRQLDVVVVGEDPTPGATAGVDRLAGIRHTLVAAGRPQPDVIACDWRVVDAYEAVRDWLARGGSAEAMITLNDRIAMGAYQALAEAGLSTPGDVSVVSFDGSELATWLRPRVTSVAIPYAEMGARAVEVLLADDWRTAGEIRLPMLVAPGESVG